jgi:hypothetical protein
VALLADQSVGIHYKTNRGTGPLCSSGHTGRAGVPNDSQKCAVNSSGAHAAPAAPAAASQAAAPTARMGIGSFCALPLYSLQVYRAMGLLAVAVPSLWQPYRPDGLRTTHSGPSRRVRALLCSPHYTHTHSLTRSLSLSLTHAFTVTHTHTPTPPTPATLAPVRFRRRRSAAVRRRSCAFVLHGLRVYQSGAFAWLAADSVRFEVAC